MSLNTRDKRKFERLGTEIDAVFSIKGGAAHTCGLRDYSRGGLYLVYTDQSQYFSIRSHGLSIGDPIRIVISVNGEDCNITCHVAHYNEAGVGARFDVNHHVNFQALEKATSAIKGNQSQATKDVSSKAPSVPLDVRNRILSKCNGYFSEFLEEAMNDYFMALDELLLKTADKQKNDSDQHPFFDAMALFNKKRNNLIDGCVKTIELTASEMSIGKARGSAQISNSLDLEVGQLSLVDKEDFEDWLIVRVLISRAELQFKELLLEMQLRLEAVFSAPGKSPLENPYSPTVLCKAFHRAVHGFKFNPAIEKVVFSAFQESLVDQLGKVYKQLNKIFIDEGVLPNVDVNHYLATLASKNRGKSSPGKKAEASSTEVADKQTDGEAVQSNGIGEAHGAQTALSANPQVGAYSDFQASMRTAKNAYSTAINLRRLHTNIGQSNVGGNGASKHVSQGSSNTPSQAGHSPGTQDSPQIEQNGAIASGGAQGNEVQTDGVLRAITSVQNLISEGNIEYSGEGALIQHIEQQIQTSGEGEVIATEEREKISMIDSLFQSILSNRQLYDELQPQFRKLEVPLLKVMMLNPEVLSEQYHPARQLVNSIALLSEKDSLNVAKNKEKIENVVDGILENYTDGDESFEHALSELAPLVEKEEFIAKRNAQRVAEALDGQQRMQNATRAVSNAIEKDWRVKCCHLHLLTFWMLAGRN